MFVEWLGDSLSRASTPSSSHNTLVSVQYTLSGPHHHVLLSVFCLTGENLHSPPLSSHTRCFSHSQNNYTSVERRVELNGQGRKYILNDGIKRRGLLGKEWSSSIGDWERLFSKGKQRIISILRSGSRAPLYMALLRLWTLNVLGTMLCALDKISLCFAELAVLAHRG